jgi:hypothetical protein
MLARKFIPGGRYLYASGRAKHQVNNCFLFRAEDSREGWADLMSKITSSLMLGGGIGADYSKLRYEGAPIAGTGGVSTGPISLMNMVNEAGRHIMQGGQRRSAIWGGLNWKHNDIPEFLALKNWSDELKALKEKDFNFPLPMEGTNISVIYDTEFFIAIEDENHPLHSKAKEVWLANCRQAFTTAEPGFSMNFLRDNESLRNAPVSARTRVLTDKGYVTVGSIVGKEVRLWTGDRWALTTFKLTKKNSDLVEVHMSNALSIVCDPEHPFIIKPHSDCTKSDLKRIAAGQLVPGMLIRSDAPGRNEFDPDVEVVSVETLDYKEDVYCCDVGVEEHSFMAEGVIISNCTEVVSEDDSDKCNLGTAWINRFKTKEEFKKAIPFMVKFLLCGGIYSDVPTDKIKEVGTKNNRIGLGIGGIHEWLITRGMDYEVTPELHKWLKVYEDESTASAYIFAKELGVSIPKGVRAIAPTGTIGIMAETTTGIEPLFCKAYKRRYLEGSSWKHQYVVDGMVKRLLDQGVALCDIKDSYDLTFKQRVKFQADVQSYVDMAISSTCNMPAWGSETNNEKTLESNAKILLKYAKRLRGFTVYPDGCRGGQPLTRVSLEEALEYEGTVFEETENKCLNGVCGL